MKGYNGWSAHLFSFAVSAHHVTWRKQYYSYSMGFSLLCLQVRPVRSEVTLEPVRMQFFSTELYFQKSANGPNIRLSRLLNMMNNIYQHFGLQLGVRRHNFWVVSYIEMLTDAIRVMCSVIVII